MNIKPIETVYRGYRFRSRLEARWGVCFDALGLEWQYEPEGFDLGESGYYLPDFYLPDDNLWIEVKPDLNSLRQSTAEAVNKAKAFRDCANSAICVVFGDPVDHAAFLACYDMNDSSAGSSDWSAVLSADSDGLTIGVLSEKDLFADALFSVRLRSFDVRTQKRHRTWGVAAHAARQARFEHGQVGAPHAWQR